MRCSIDELFVDGSAVYVGLYLGDRFVVRRADAVSGFVGDQGCLQGIVRSMLGLAEDGSLRRLATAMRHVSLTTQGPTKRHLLAGFGVVAGEGFARLAVFTLNLLTRHGRTTVGGYAVGLVVRAGRLIGVERTTTPAIVADALLQGKAGVISDHSLALVTLQGLAPSTLLGILRRVVSAPGRDGVATAVKGEHVIAGGPPINGSLHVLVIGPDASASAEEVASAVRGLGFACSVMPVRTEREY